MIVVIVLTNLRDQLTDTVRLDHHERNSFDDPQARAKSVHSFEIGTR